MFNQEEFNQFVLDNQVVGFFKEPITLKSGRVSHWYVNWRNIAEDVFLLEQLADVIVNFTEHLGLDPDCFYGVPEGATKIGVVTQLKWAKHSFNYGKGSHGLPMGRGKPKEHGEPKDKFFLGVPRGKVIVVEDVTTTGGSLLETIQNLQEAGISVLAAFGLTNRNEKGDDGQTVTEAVGDLGVPYFALSNALDLLPKLCWQNPVENHIVQAVEDYFARYGDKKLQLKKSGTMNIELTFKEQLAREKVCLPLDDLNTLDEVKARVEELAPVVGMFKIGKELFTRFGPEVIKLVQSYGVRVFFDSKFHDIPNTVKGAAQAAAELGVYMFNVHASGGVEMMQAALEGAKSGAAKSGNPLPKIIGVSVLTSIDQMILNQQMRVLGKMEDQVLNLAKLASLAGLDGVVCSAADLAAIKEKLPSDFIFVTPGIKGPNTPAGADQKRVFTPGNAVQDGSSILVIGRTITDQPNTEARLRAGKEILEDMARFI